jgi:hypothetical protein
LQKYECEKECKKSKSAGVGLSFSDKKIIPQNLEQVGTDGSSVGIPPVLQKRKTSEFRPKPILGREKHWEFRSEPILGIETPSEFRSEPFLGREKPSEFRSKPFLGRENPSEFCSEPCLVENNLGIPFRIIFRPETTWEKDNFC